MLSGLLDLIVLVAIVAVAEAASLLLTPQSVVILGAVGIGVTAWALRPPVPTARPGEKIDIAIKGDGNVVELWRTRLDRDMDYACGDKEIEP